jgi:hypothetical protein
VPIISVIKNLFRGNPFLQIFALLQLPEVGIVFQDKIKGGEDATDQHPQIY